VPTELVWDGKYKDGKKSSPLRISLPFQDVETVNESAQERQKMLDLFSSGRPTEWRNRLIWGDKRYVLPSLLDEFAGKVNLVYIDPPFDTGADFSLQVTIDGENFTKEPSIIEQKAYRDTWGLGLDSYLQWFYETAVLLRDLLAEQGSIYVHLDYHVGHYAKAVLDEVFGADNFRNEIIVKRRITKNLQQQFKTVQALSWGHDNILWYSKNSQTRFAPILVPLGVINPEGYWHHFWSNADRPTMRYELLGVTPPKGQWKWSKERALRAVENYEKYLSSSKGQSLASYWEGQGKQLEFIRLSKTGKVENWFPPSSDRIADTLWTDVHAYENEKEYATQKHTDLLARIIKGASAENDLVLDCFAGSGTTAAVAEKLGRRWITCDLGRFAVHTTRKRLLGIQGVKPFIVQNLGKYERQLWQADEFGPQATLRVAAYTTFILDLYHAQPLAGRTWLHGVKGNRVVHVGSIDSPVTLADVRSIIIEWQRNVGKSEVRTTGIDVLGWDFAFELNEVARQQALDAGVDLKFYTIPREVLEKKAVEQGDIQFFELAALFVNTQVAGRTLTVELTNFVPPLDYVPQEVRAKITAWESWIDYWAVDFDFKGDTFHNEWQSYRTKANKAIATKTTNAYDSPGTYCVNVKVIDILGNDTTRTLHVKIA